MLQEKQYHFFISLNPNTSIFNSPQKNLLNSFCKRTFVSKYHLYYISTDMENTTHKEETHKTLFARMRQRLKERKRRVMRLIELKRLRRIRKKLYPGTPIARIAVPSWRECIAIVADNMPSTSTSPSGITSESLQAARHFQVDSTGTALTPVYEWKEDHSDEAQQLRQESFLNQFLETYPNGLRST